jgi:hypothetical protein
MIYAPRTSIGIEHWTSKPKVASSIATADVKQTFQLARCGHIQRQHHKHIFLCSSWIDHAVQKNNFFHWFVQLGKHNDIID